VWRTGLAVSPDAGGVVTKEELRRKVEQVVGDAEIRERARLLKDAARRCISQGGSSCDNLKKFVKLTGACLGNGGLIGWKRIEGDFGRF
jgi:hypothetical protein